MKRSKTKVEKVQNRAKKGPKLKLKRSKTGQKRSKTGQKKVQNRAKKGVVQSVVDWFQPTPVTSFTHQSGAAAYYQPSTVMNIKLETIACLLKM